MPGMAANTVAFIIGTRVLFGAIASKFHSDIAACRRERIVK